MAYPWSIISKNTQSFQEYGWKSARYCQQGSIKTLESFQFRRDIGVREHSHPDASDGDGDEPGLCRMVCSWRCYRLSQPRGQCGRLSGPWMAQVDMWCLSPFLVSFSLFLYLISPTGLFQGTYLKTSPKTVSAVRSAIPLSLQVLESPIK